MCVMEYALGGGLHCVVCWDIDRAGISTILTAILVFLYSWADRCEAYRLAGAECIARTARLHKPTQFVYMKRWKLTM